MFGEGMLLVWCEAHHPSWRSRSNCTHPPPPQLAHLVEYQEWQKKVHEEIDRVTNNGRRFLEWEDRAETPTLLACMAESARCRPIAVMTAPHMCSKDTTLDG